LLHDTITKKTRKNCKNSKKTLQKSTKNPQANQEVIFSRKNIKINVGYEKKRDTRIGAAVKYYFFYEEYWENIKFIALPIFF
jgi:hypothetical protein